MADDLPAQPLTSKQLCAHAGITYRKLDFWTRSGYLRPDDPTPGTGASRSYPPDEVEVAVRMARLVDAGLTVPAAARIARGDTAATNRLCQVLEEAAR